MRNRFTELALRTSLLYAAIAALWILLSGKLLYALVPDVAVANQLEIYKGWVFVMVTAGLLYWGLRRQMRHWEKEATERKVAERALRESEARLSTIFHHSPVGIVITRLADGTVVDVNEAFANLHGYARDEILGRSSTNLNMWANPAERDAMIEQLRAQGTCKDLDIKSRKKTGEIRDLRISVELVELAGEQFTLGLARDVTERKQTEQALRENEERLRQIVTQTRCILNYGEVIGPEGWREKALQPESPFGWNFPVQNEKVAQDICPLELRPQEHYQQAWVRSRHREDHVQMNWNSANAFLYDLPFYRNEFRCTDRHGHDHWMQQFVTVEKLTENRWRIFGITTDVSDLKQGEKALRHSKDALTRERALLRALVDSIPDLIFFKNQESVFLGCNQSFTAYFGLSERELVGKTDYDILSRAEADFNRQTDLEMLVSGKMQQNEEWIPSQIGQKRLFETIKTPYHGPQGELLGLIGISREITERKETEQMLKFVAQKGWDARHENFLAQLVEYIGRTLGVDYVFVGRLKDPQTVQTTGLYAKGKIVPDIEYNIRGAPCSNVIGRTLCHYGERLQELFPEDALLGQMGAQSYLGIPLADSSGKPAGLLAVLDTKPMLDSRLGAGLLQIASVRAAGELERMAAEATLQKTNRALVMVSDCHQALIRATNEIELLAGICRLIVAERGYVTAWAGYAEADAAKTVRPVAHAGFESDHVRRLNVTWGDAGHGLCPVGKAIHTSQPYIVQDIFNELPSGTCPEQFKDLGHVAMCTLPLMAGDRALGVLVVYSTEPHAFNAEEVSLLVELAGDLGYGITVLRARAENQRMEAALQMSQALYHSLVEQMPAGVFRKNAEGRYVFVNSLFCRLKSLKPEDFLGKKALQVAASEPARLNPNEAASKYAAKGEELHKLIMQTGISVEEEEVYSNAAGEKQFFHVVRIPVVGTDGKVIGTQGMLFDVTQLKQAEESYMRLATAVEQAAEAILITNPGGKILYVNPAFETITGYPPQEVIGQNPRLLKSGKQDAAFYQQMWAVLAQGGVWSGRIINKKKDGTLFEEESTISPIRDATGKIVNYVAVKRDVTREIKLETQLRQSQKMEAIGQLAGGVAHDFNNLLTAIHGNASLLTDGQLPPAEIQDSAEQIIEAAERAAGLTRQLLMFSRKQVMQPVILDLNEVVAQMTKLLQRILGEDITLASNYAPHLPLIHADTGMVEQILLNLAVNSRDAMPGGGQLTIATGTETLTPEQAKQYSNASPGAYVRLSVTDTGCGIAPENLSHIFEPFFTTKEVGKGTGLGLATVYGIVQQHHGWIAVTSEISKGTTFRIYVPAVTDAKAMDKHSRARPQLPRGSETILVVEDDLSVRLLATHLLQRCGYHVLSADTGTAALELWRIHVGQIQLLVTDMVMPGGLTGRELAEHLSREKSGLKIIYISGYSLDFSKKEFPLIEGRNFLQKPFSPLKLAEIVRSALDAK